MPQLLRSRSNRFPNGLQTAESEFIREGFSQLDNWYPSFEDGAIEVFPGFSAADITWDSDTPTKITGLLYTLESDETPTLFVVGVDSAGTAKSLWYLTPNDLATTRVNDGLDVDAPLEMAVFEDVAYFFNGVDDPFRVDLDTLTSGAVDIATLVGIARPDVSSSSSALTGAGPLIGEVQYWISYVDESGDDPIEGPLSEAFGAINTLDGNRVDLSVLPTSGSLTRRIYRSRQEGVIPRFLTALNNTDTSYRDEKADTELGPPPYLHGESPPPGLTQPVVHANRLWGIKGEKIYFTDRNYPESWYTDFNYVIGASDGDVLVAVARDEAGFFLWKTRRMYKLVVQDPEVEDARIYELTSSDDAPNAIGCGAPRSIVSTDVGLFWYYDQAFYRIQDSRITLVSNPIRPELLNMKLEYETQITGSYDSSRRMVFWSVPGSTSTGANTETWGYHVDRDAWFRVTAGFHAMAYVFDGSARAIWTSYVGDDGNIHPLFDGSSVDFAGTGFTAIAEMPPFYTVRPSNLSRIRGGELVYKVMDKTLTVEFVLDGDTSTPGTASLDMDEAATGLVHREAWFGVNRRAHDIRWIFKHTVSDAATADGLYPKLFAFNIDAESLGSMRI